MDEMELFLVRATIAQSEYMGVTSQFEDIRLVKASGDREVEQKYYRYWESRGSAFGTSYFVLEFVIQDTIG